MRMPRLPVSRHTGSVRSTRIYFKLKISCMKFFWRTTRARRGPPPRNGRTAPNLARTWPKPGPNLAQAWPEPGPNLARTNLALQGRRLQGGLEGPERAGRRAQGRSKDASRIGGQDRGPGSGQDLARI